MSLDNNNIPPKDKGDTSGEVVRSGEIVRLNAHERLQHLLTFTTFFILVATGYMLRMPEEWILWLGPYGAAVFEYRAITHRVAGVIMIVGGGYHIMYLIVHHRGRSFFFGMIPKLKDAIDIFQNLAYYLGLRAKPPEFERFDYREKMEYIFLIAGTIIISTTGILLWSEGYWSKFVLDLSLLIHGMEAILASLAIIVWHFYAIHYKPGKFPMSWIWITGKMPLHELEEEHPLQYKRLIEQGVITPEDIKLGHAVVPKRGILHFIFRGFSFVSFIFFVGVGALLVKLLFFPASYEYKVVERGKLETFLHATDAMEKVGHFHNIDESTTPDVANLPICVQCHGTLPHSKSPDLRSFLNMHNYFMACETCHVHQSEIDKPLDFVWFDNQTDEVVEKVAGDNGVYGARLVPVLASADGSIRLDQSGDKDFAREYMATKDQLSPQELAKSKVILHKGLSKKPVQCTECHGKKPYIDFAVSGYDPVRAESLYRTEVADMISRYMEFYLPTMFDPDLMRKQKAKLLEEQDRSTD